MAKQGCLCRPMMAKQGSKLGRPSVPRFTLLPERHFRLKICLYRPLMAKQGCLCRPMMAKQGSKLGRLSVPRFTLLPERHFRLKICLYRPLMAKQGCLCRPMMAKQGSKLGRLSVPQIHAAVGRKFVALCMSLLPRVQSPFPLRLLHQVLRPEHYSSIILFQGINSSASQAT